MKKIAITGVSGFVAGHFIDYLYAYNALHAKHFILGLVGGD